MAAEGHLIDERFERFVLVEQEDLPLFEVDELLLIVDDLRFELEDRTGSEVFPLLG